VHVGSRGITGRIRNLDLRKRDRLSQKAKPVPNDEQTEVRDSAYQSQMHRTPTKLMPETQIGKRALWAKVWLILH
jgi:hypothetical protein